MSRSDRRPLVMKFGGTSVMSKEAWEAIVSVARARVEAGFRPLIVCSAISGVSDMLERLADEAVRGRYEPSLQEVLARHADLAGELGVDRACLAPYEDEAARLARGISLVREASPKTRARLLSLGELMLTKIGDEYLRACGLTSQWFDARAFIVADEIFDRSDSRAYLAARCDARYDGALCRKVSEGRFDVSITQGFIASDADGDTVLLGRGGSDVSAAYFAAKIAAERCEIWTDVPGMYTANPRVVPDARLLRRVDYDEAQEIASLGAKVLHPKTIAPMKRAGIPIHIFSLTTRGADGGTTITSESARMDAGIKAISIRRGITVISMETVEMLHQVGFLATIFGCFRDHGISIDLISTSETNVTVTVDRAENPDFKGSALLSLLKDLKAHCQPRVIESCGSVSLVGKNVRGILHRISAALEAFEDHRIYLVSHAASDLNITFVVDEGAIEKLMVELHHELFGQDRAEAYLGPLWSAPAGRAGPAAGAPWWLAKRDALLGLASKQTPVYAYDPEVIEKRIALLTSMESCDRIFYSLKANPNRDVLEIVERAGLGFECVSLPEVQRVAELASSIDPGRILFTPNFVGPEEYAMAFKAGAMVTVDNAYLLERWPELFRGREIGARLDPGQGRGHHKYVQTAGAKSKFGIAEEDLDRFRSLADGCGARVVMLHAHIGSNIFKPQAWSETFAFLAEHAPSFPHLAAIDVGGGLGVPERPGQQALDLAALDDELSRAKAAFPGLSLWIEPGRYLIAEAGVLLAKATQIKRKGDYFYVGVDAGMNALIRPALYGAYHEIYNLSRPDGEQVIANIVGPICESGDFLGHSRAIALPEPGDIILIATAGAYGRAMSSQYNMRMPPIEAFVT